MPERDPRATPDGDTPLRLRARDEEDLAILSAQLQDAILPVHDMTWEPVARRFVMVVNRFCWNIPPAEVDGRTVWSRTLCGVRFESVTTVRRRGIDPAGERGRMLSVLAVRLEKKDILTIDFAGDAAIRLVIDALDVRLEDRGLPWPTLWRPRHDAVEDGRS